MTDNDYRLEDRPESQKRKEGRPNYALRRMNSRLRSSAWS